MEQLERANVLLEKEAVAVASSLSMDELPEWPEGTVAVLSTATARTRSRCRWSCAPARATLLVGLAPRRESLERLREDPRCAVTILAAGDHAFTAYGRAAAHRGGRARSSACAIEVDEIADHNRPTYTIDDGVQWRWTDDDGAARATPSRARH